MTDCRPRLLTPAQARTRLAALPDAATAPARSRAELRRAAEDLVGLCAQILTGRHPLAALRGHCDGAAFGQFAALHRRIRPDNPTALSLRHNDTDASGGLTMVALFRVGTRTWAVSLCARHRRQGGWRLTQCRLVEPDRPVSGVGGTGGGAILMP